MGTQIKGTICGTLKPDGSITNATISPDVEPPQQVQVAFLRPPSLRHLLDQIANGTIVANDTKVERLRGDKGHSFYASQVTQEQRKPANKVVLPHGLEGSWSSAAQDSLMRWVGNKVKPKSSPKKPTDCGKTYFWIL